MEKIQASLFLFREKFTSYNDKKHTFQIGGIMMMNLMQMLQGSLGIALGITLGGYLLMYVTAMVIMHTKFYKRLLKYVLRMTVELQEEVVRLIEEEEAK